jgi:fatty-acyl-CoA synthase
VGKVFKPTLRWAAAQRVFDELLAPLRHAGVTAEVEVVPDQVHGSVATVRLKGAPGTDGAAVERSVAELFAPFVTKHRVEWS